MKLPDGTLERLIAQGQSAKYALWVGDGYNLYPWIKQIHPLTFKSVEVLERRIVKDKMSPADKVNDWVTKAIANGTVLTIGWRVGSNPNTISLTKELLLPHMRAIGETARTDGWQKAVPKARSTIRDAVRSGFDMDEALRRVCRRGCINGEFASTDEVMGIALTWMAENPYLLTSIESLIAYSEQDLYASDDGEIERGPQNSGSFLFTAVTHIGSRSEYGVWIAENAYACGSVVPITKNSLIMTPTSAGDLHIDALALLRAGYPVTMEEKSRTLWPAGWVIEDGEGNIVYRNALDGLKPHKAPARNKMPISVHATIDETKEGVEVHSNLAISTSDGPKRLMKGVELTVAAGTFVSNLTSGGEHARRIISVVSERTVREQMLKEQASAINKDGMIGQVVPVGHSLVGVDGFCLNFTRFPVRVMGITVEEVDDASFANIVVRCQQEFDLSVAKLRGFAKAQMINWGDQPGGFPWKIFGNDNVELVLGGESIKNPDSLYRGMWAQTYRDHMVEWGPNGFADAKDERDYAKWLKSSIRKSTVRLEIDESMVEIMKIAGHKVYSRNGRHWFKYDAEYRVGKLVLGVESLPAQGRVSRAALTPPMLTSLIMDQGNVHEVTYSGKVIDMLGDSTFPGISMKQAWVMFYDGKDPRPWKDFLAMAVKSFPNGATLKVPVYNKPDLELAVDFKALRLFTHGTVSPDDAFGMLVYRSIAMYAKIRHIMMKMPDRMVENIWQAQPETPEEHQLLLSWKSTYTALVSSMKRARGAMFSLGFSNGMLRRMATPARIVPLLPVMGSHVVPMGTIILHPETAEAMKVVRYSDEEETILENYFLVRFPGDGYARVHAVMSELAPKGIVVANSADVQIGTKGDSDGDLIMIVARKDLPSMIHRGRVDRETIIRYVRMMVVNGGAKPVQLEVLPFEVANPQWKEEDLMPMGSRDRYTRFMDLKSTPIVDWYKPTTIWTRRSAIAEYNITAYADQMQRQSVFGTNGIGSAYNAWHVSVVMAAAWYGISTYNFNLWRHAVEICATIYEDVYLAGSPGLKQWRFHELFRSPKVEELDEWRQALEDLGYSKIRQKVAMKKEVDGVVKYIEYDWAQLLYAARIATLAYQSYYQTGKVPKERADQLGQSAHFIPLVGLMRAFFGYQLHPSWMRDLMTSKDVAKALSLLNDKSPIFKYWRPMLQGLFPTALNVARTGQWVNAIHEDEY